MLARTWQRNEWGRAVVQLRSILSTHSILQGTSVGPPPPQMQEPLGQYVDVASRLLQSRVQQSPLNQALLKDSRTFAHRSPNTKSHLSEPVRPLAQSDGHDPPGLIDELVPCLAAVIDEASVGFKDTVGEPVVAHE